MTFKKGDVPWDKGKHRSEETKRKIGLAHIGNKYFLGMHHSEKTKKKISLALKGRRTSPSTEFKIGHVVSEETRLNIGKGNKGKTRTEEIVKRIKELHGGKYHTDETIRKIVKKKIGVSLTFSDAHRKFLAERLKNLRIMRPTKPQLKLFEIIKTQYPDKDVVMEYTVKTSDSYRFIDVAVPELKLGFEYDAPYWHQDKEKDQLRHNLIEAKGWKLIHYSNILDF